jgi:hypothetical protein
MAHRRLKEGDERLTEGYRGLEKAHRALAAPHFPLKVRDTEFSNQIIDLGKFREGYVSLSDYVQRPNKRRCRRTKPDTGLVSVTGRRSL